MLEALTGAIEHMSTASYWVAFLTGIGIATAVGILPGIGSTSMLAITLPIVVLGIDEPAIGIVMLAVITGTGNTFDSIPAQLMGIVSSGTQVTFLEGHQLTRKGLGAYSLGAVYAVSAIGGLVGAACLLVAIPFLRPFILSMSFGEIATLALFGITMVGVLSHGAMAKGLASGMIGIFLGTVGLQAYTGVERFTFGSYDLRAGLPLVAAVAGFMAIPEMLDLAVSRKPVAPADSVVSTREVLRGFREGLRRWKMAIRHSIIGVVIGALPGSGGNTVTWISYGLGMAFTKDKSEFGKGSLDGLLFAESSENAKEGGQAIPTLALGVPGGTSWALVLAALMAYGITPGPRMLSDNSDIIGLIVISFALANLVITLLALLVTRQLMRLTLVPYAGIVAPVLPIVVLGAYFSDLTMAIIPVIIVFAILGLAMKQFGWPRPPLVLGFILSGAVEDNLWSAMGVHGVVGMLTRPLTIILFAIVVLSAVYLHRTMNKAREPVADQLESLADLALVDTVDEALILTGPTPGVGTMAVATSDGTAEVVELPDTGSGSARGLHWRTEHILPIVFIVLAVLGAIETLDFSRTAARYLPLSMCLGVIGLCGFQLYKQARQPVAVRGQILDIDLRSVGIEGSKRLATVTGALLAVYLAAMAIIGLRWAGVIFALLAPLFLMRTRSRYAVSAFSVVFYIVFVVFIGDQLLNIFWPRGLLLR